MNKVLIATIFAITALPVTAQENASAPLPVQRAKTDNAVLPAGTEILLRMAQEVTTKGRTWDEGDTFVLNVAHDVMLGDYVIIPQGARAVGRITWLTNKGMFGKSGKMDIELEYVEVMGRRINVDGTYRQEGEGNTVATVGGVVAAGPFAAFITGRSGTIPQGRELMSTLESDLVLDIPAGEVGQGRGAAPLPVVRRTNVQELMPTEVAPEDEPEQATSDDVAPDESVAKESMASVPEFVSEPVEQAIETASEETETPGG